MDTIAAIATPRLPCAIGILRLSGPDTDAIVSRVFRPAADAALPARKMVYGTLLDESGQPLDQVLCVRFPCPHSYTGEDSAELHCHGSPMVLERGLAALFAAGARQAQGGEFTRRAFLNGRMDLLQAEAVVDLIDAETAEAARSALGQLSGALSRGVEAIYDSLMAVIARFYAVVDYPDEDIEDVERPQLEAALSEARGRLAALKDTFRRGQILRMGVPTVIVGRPNAGKSSLLNALLGYDRAIVTDIPGTTRDTVEEKVPLGRVLLRLIDTAGIRAQADTVEALGIDRARAAAEDAALALLVLDGAAPLTEEDEAAIAVAQRAERLLVVVNKSDLPPAVDGEALRRRFGEVITLSAKTGAGIDALQGAVEALFPPEQGQPGQLLTNARQADAVGRALDAVTAALDSLRRGLTPDAVLTDAEAALAALGELNGKNIREDLVDTIFSRFCVGK
ncbi:MAG: tRNA uridine-5-carboxymethylaminomethyl(34) synthesis GTPase MnmE [Oscillospiraceae bacterium]|nr:tRNA uridine-5-carboxymethylaminomethyl(34) synthesis GTPase MnmE [Oscillospiraceae bacterium]